MKADRKAEIDQVREPRYTGFISYSQKDKAWADRIHRALERYRLPAGLPQERRDIRRLGRFFKDDDELAGTANLGAALESAIDDSLALIVICSPHAASSKWVDTEIRRFKSRGPNAKVLPVIVAGRPDAEDPDQRCFPPALLRRVDEHGRLTGEPDEPLAPDASKEQFRRLITRLAAGLIGVSFDALWHREKRRQTQRQVVAAAAAIVLATGAGFATKSVLVSEKQRLVAESLNLATAAQTALDEGRVSDALRDLLTALPRDLDTPDRPLVPEALVALRRALADNAQEGIIARYESAITALHETPAGHLAVYRDGGLVSVIDKVTGAELRSIEEYPSLAPLGQTGLAQAFFINAPQLVDGTWIEGGTVRVVGLDPGVSPRSASVMGADWWPIDAVSPDGSLFLAKSQEKGSLSPAALATFRLGDGHDVKVTDPDAVTDAPFIDVDIHISASFGDADTVYLSWGTERKALAVWNIGEGNPRLLVDVDSDPGCNTSEEVDPERHDSVLLSPDRSIVTHARALPGDAWCARTWDGATGAAISERVLTEAPAAGIVALSADHYAIGKLSSKWDSRAELRTATGQRFTVKGCEESLINSLTIESAIPAWMTDLPASITACAVEKDIQVLVGPGFSSVGSFRGHEGKVTSLWLDGAERILWSGAEGGTVRRWAIPAAPLLALDLAPVTAAVVDGPNVAALYRDTNGSFVLQAHDGSGNPVSPRVPFQLLPVPGVQNEPYRDVEPVLLANGLTMGVAEAFDCGFLACPEGYRNNRLTLWRVADGAQLLQVDGMARDGFLRRTPVALHRADAHAMLLLSDGSARLVDPVSGEVLREIRPPEGAFLRTAAYAYGSWWFSQEDEPNAPERRHVEILRLVGEAGPDQALELVDRRFSQGTDIFAAPDGKGLVIAHSYARPGDRPFSLSIANADGTVVEVKGLPDRLSTSSIEAVTFSGSGGIDRKAAIFFGDHLNPPMVMSINDGVLDPLATSQPGSLLETWRVIDPIGRAAISTGNNRLSIFSYDQAVPGGMPLCPRLNGADADAAVISQDGSKLALASNGSIGVYNLDTCTVERDFDADVRSLHPLAFASDGSLWIWPIDGQFRIVRPSVTDAELLDRLHRLAN